MVRRRTGSTSPETALSFRAQLRRSRDSREVVAQASDFNERADALATKRFRPPARTNNGQLEKVASTGQSARNMAATSSAVIDTPCAGVRQRMVHAGPGCVCELECPVVSRRAHLETNRGCVTMIAGVDCLTLGVSANQIFTCSPVRESRTVRVI
jgi:hypothetical protein